MNRRRMLLRGVMAAGSIATRSMLARAFEKSTPEEVRFTVHADQPVGRIPQDFVGLGYEISSVARLGVLSATNTVYVQLVRTLGRHGVIRIGGNTADYAHYSATASPVSSPVGTVVNDAVLGDLGRFLEVTGWKLIWALDLGRGSVAEAVAEARRIVAIGGDRLLAFEIGNEPDLFAHEKHRGAGYDYAQWLADYRRYKQALRAELPKIRFAGPDVAGRTEWVTKFAADEGHDAVLLTHHYYREGQNPGSTIAKLLGPDPKLLPQLETLHTASQTSGIPYRICEVNSFSGGGRPGVSDTMAGALWALDYMFTLASNGCSGVNMETGVNQLGFVSSYSPIGDDQHSHYEARPEYYGMLAFALAGRGDLVRVESDGANTALKGYACRIDGDETVVTLINKGASACRVGLTLHGLPRASRGSLIRLRAPAADANSGVLIGEAAVAADGTWKAKSMPMARLANERLRVELPAASAVLVQIRS